MQMHTFDRIAKYAAVICVAALALTGAGHLAPVTFIDHAKVQEATMKGGVLITAPDLQVLASSRSKPGEVEIHEKITDVLYVLDGEAIMVTGGTIVGGTTVPADPNADMPSPFDARYSTKRWFFWSLAHTCPVVSVATPSGSESVVEPILLASRRNPPVSLNSTRRLSTVSATHTFPLASVAIP